MIHDAEIRTALNVLDRIAGTLDRIDRTLKSIDTGITDVVHVVEENADTVKGAVGDAADAIASAVEPKEEEEQSS